jgi:hypothetical protein
MIGPCRPSFLISPSTTSEKAKLVARQWLQTITLKELSIYLAVPSLATHVGIKTLILPSFDLPGFFGFP